MTWNTFLGGSLYDNGNAIAVDTSGNVYIVGDSWTTWGGSPIRPFGGNTDAFVAKLNGSGVLQWNTFLGGSAYDSGTAIAVDTVGNVYVEGLSTATWGSPVRAFAGGYNDTFAAKLNGNGALQWNTFLGGSDVDQSQAIAADTSGNVYVAGYSSATWGSPVHAFTGSNAYDAFIAKLDGNGALQWNTFQGSIGYDLGQAIAADSSGNVYVAGMSDATWGSPVNPHSGNNDAYAARLNNSGVLQWNTFLGSGLDDLGRSVAVDASGNVYVAGESPATWGTPFIPYGGSLDAFAAKLNNSGVRQWNTFLGSSGDDSGSGIAVDSKGGVYVTGYSTVSWGSPVNPLNGSYKDAFVARISSPIRVDFVGTWDGQGVYFRNSETSKYVNLSSPADLIAAGDLDGDGKDDLIGIWPGQGGVWARYSKTGAWAKLSSTAKHIAAGDMNGDGRKDLVGTWDGQGVYYRDSKSGTWIKLASPADLITAGDLDGDGSDDLIGIWPTQGGIWVKYSKIGTWAKLSSSARDIATGDMNDDGREDLVGTWDGQGVYYRNSISGAWVKISIPGEQVAAGDLDGDGLDDLIGLWASQGGIYVKYSTTGAWSKLSTPAKDIATGLMRGAFWGSSRFGFIGLQGPLGGYADGPSNLSKYRDMSSEGPGGWRFAAQEEKNLIPHATGRALVLPGPGDPGFFCSAQGNLIPQEQDKALKDKRDRESKENIKTRRK